jgi:hypothetical protein
MNQESFSNAVRNLYAMLSIMVLFYHSGANNPEFLYNAKFATIFFDSIRMPLYFFIGGLVVERQIHRRPAVDILKRRFNRLIVPFLWFAPIYYLVETSLSNTDYRRPESLLFSLIYPGYHLWFLPAFFLASFVGLLQAKYIKSLRFNVAFVLFAVVVSLKLNGEGDGFFASNALIELLPYSTLGVLLSRALFSVDAKIPFRYYFSVLTFLLILTLLDYPGIQAYLVFLILPFIFFAAGSLRAGFRLRTLGDHTLQIYLFSPLGIGLSRYILNLYGGLGVTQEVFLNALFGLMMTLIIVWFSRKTTLTRFLIGL